MCHVDATSSSHPCKTARTLTVRPTFGVILTYQTIHHAMRCLSLRRFAVSGDLQLRTSKFCIGEVGVRSNENVSRGDHVACDVATRSSLHLRPAVDHITLHIIPCPRCVCFAYLWTWLMCRRNATMITGRFLTLLASRPCVL